MKFINFANICAVVIFWIALMIAIFCAGIFILALFLHCIGYAWMHGWNLI